MSEILDTIQVIHVITEPKRFQIIQLLFTHPYCVKALSKKLGISEPAVSQHLSVLKKHEIVCGEKKGYQMHYQIRHEVISSLLNEMAEYISVNLADRTADCTCEFASSCIRKDSHKTEEQIK